jgi:hypothetical protein
MSSKWNLAGKMTGGAPSSYWFKWNGIVIAPWENHKFAFISECTYEFSDNRHMRIKMNQRYYKGNVYNFKSST